ncbi:ATP-binding protein [Streptomyces sp. DT195]|uniref:ATP-binding protein n=1 Tax=Streptomyces sp. DT195 TaxID=3393419 RepID=UPI003CEBB246
MSDRASPTSSVAHGRRRRHSSEIEHLLLAEVRSAVAAFAVPAAVALVAAAVLRWTAGISGGVLVGGAAVVLLVLGAVAARRARTAAGTVYEAWVAAQEASAQAVHQEQAAAAETQRRAQDAWARERADAQRSWAAERGGIEQAVAAVRKAISWSAEELRRGGVPPIPEPDAAPGSSVLRSLSALQAEAVEEMVRVRTDARTEVGLAMLVQTAKRTHVLIGRALNGLQELAEQTEDPELLDKIWRIDHQVTRTRRHVESTAVMGGESLSSGRREPVSVRAVVRGAISEVTQYGRCTAVTHLVPAQMAVRGYVGRDVSHVVAELLDNSLASSAPETRVVVTVQQVPAGLAVEVVDRAIGMTGQARERLNRMLSHPDEVDISEQVRSGRIGLPTAAKIGQRHGLTVELAANAAGGTTALVVVPAKHLLRLADTPAPAPAPPVPTSAVPQPDTQQGGRLEGISPPSTGPTASAASAVAVRGPGAPPALPRRPAQQTPVVVQPEAPSRPAGTKLTSFRSGARAARSAGSLHGPGQPDSPPHGGV